MTDTEIRLGLLAWSQYTDCRRCVTGRCAPSAPGTTTSGPRLASETFARNGGADVWSNCNVGTPEMVADRLCPFVELGYGHLIAGCPSRYDEKSIERLATEVKPLLRAH
ncbi:MAG: hypothetical protein ABR509_06470 [Candidatus Limnocylindria bacterium]